MTSVKNATWNSKYFFFFQVFKSLSMCTKFRFNCSSLSKKVGKEGALPPPPPPPRMFYQELLRKYRNTMTVCGEKKYPFIS